MYILNPDAAWRGGKTRCLRQIQATAESYKVAAKYGHRILFTPPYWPQFQPIEMAWGIVKGDVALNRSADTYDVEHTLLLLKAAFGKVPRWRGVQGYKFCTRTLNFGGGDCIAFRSVVGGS